MASESRWVWSGAIAGVVLVVAIGVFAWLYRHSDATPPPPPPPLAAAEPAAAPASSAPEPELHYPVETASAPEAHPPSLADVLVEAFGPAARSMFQFDGFARRFVATVDNLGRAHASPLVWPLAPAAGRFTVEGQAPDERIGAANAARYAPYVSLLDKADPAALASTYRRLYPEFQKAYEELGFPGKYFNDRLVKVIDLLLATPQIEAPAVKLPNAGAGAEPTRPWAVYQFADPALQALTSGQKILLRMGPANERIVKAKLAAFRKLVTANAVPRQPR